MRRFPCFVLELLASVIVHNRAYDTQSAGSGSKGGKEVEKQSQEKKLGFERATWTSKFGQNPLMTERNECESAREKTSHTLTDQQNEL